MNEEKSFPEENQENNEIEPLQNQSISETVDGENEPDLQETPLESEGQAISDETIDTSESPDLETETPSVQTPDEKKSTPPWVKKTLIWFVILVLVFLSGVIVSQLTSVTPLRNNLQNITRQNIDHLAEIDELKTELDSTKNDLSNTKSELSDIRSTLSESNQTLAASQQELQRQTSLLDLKFNIAEARVAAANQDKLSLRQSLNLAEKNLDQLQDILEPEIYEIIQERLETIQKTAKSNLTKAAEELRMLSENLIRIE